MRVEHAAKYLLLAAPVGLAMCAGSQARPGGDSGAAGSPGIDASVTMGTGGGDAAATVTGDSAPSDAGVGNNGEAGDGQDAASVPAACPASDVGNTALGTDTPDPTGTAVTAITYTNVGATGSYDRVVTSTVAPTCTPNVCDKAATPVSGPLAPIELYQLAVYDPAAAGSYTRIAYWDRCTTEALAFVGNDAWYQCNGYVQS